MRSPWWARVYNIGYGKLRMEQSLVRDHGACYIPGVVGGVLLEMNGKRYDNTLRHRLQAIHAALIAEA